MQENLEIIMKRIQKNGTLRADKNQMQAVDGKQRIYLEWPNASVIEVFMDFIPVARITGSAITEAILYCLSLLELLLSNLSGWKFQYGWTGWKHGF